MKTSGQQTAPEGKASEYRGIFDAVSDGLIVGDLGTGLVVEANPAACGMHGYAREEFIGLQLKAIVHPESREAFDRQIAEFQAEAVFDSRAVHVRRDGSTFHAEWRGTAFAYQGRPHFLGILRDVSKRIQAEQLLHEGVEARTHEQAALLEISHTLASTLEFQPGLILDQLRGIIEYSQGGLFGLEDDTLVALATRGTPRPEQTPPFRIALPGPESPTTLFNGRRPIRIADVRSDQPQAQSLRALLDDGAAGLLEGMQSWMWVPLMAGSRMMGGVGVAHDKRNYFTAHHANLVLSLANQAAITMLNAELNQQARTLAVVQERQRLAQNLHDAVNQSLFSAGLIAEVLPRLWDRDQEEARRSLEDLRRLTRGALAEMRGLLAELRPSTLTDSNLGDLLRLLGSALSGRINIPVDVTVTGEPILPTEARVAFYRICQEALNNVAKHAGATRVEIDLKHEADAVELCIRDDGRGFDAEYTTSGHYGLDMMHERADAVGALLSITSRPGHGTELSLRWAEAGKSEA